MRALVVVAVAFHAIPILTLAGAPEVGIAAALLGALMGVIPIGRKQGFSARSPERQEADFLCSPPARRG